MRFIAIIIAVFVCCSCKKPDSGTRADLAFMCEGRVETFHANSMLPQKEQFSVWDDKLGLVISNNYVSIKNANSVLDLPVVYPNALNSDITWDMKICNSENHEIAFNNYSCNFNMFSQPAYELARSRINILDGSFDGVTNTLMVHIKPLDIVGLLDRKESYKTQNATYDCKQIKPSI